MNSIIIRVVNNPNSNTSMLCYPSQGKPFVVSKAKHKAIKPGKSYLVDLQTKAYADNTKVFVYGIKVHGEIAIKKGK